MFLEQYFEKFNDYSTNPLSYENNPNYQMSAGHTSTSVSAGHTSTSMTVGDIIKIEFSDKTEYWV